MKPMELAKLGAGFVLGKVATAAVQAFLPAGGSETALDDFAFIAVAGLASYKAVKGAGKYNKVWAGAALGSVSPVLDNLASKAIAAIPGIGA